VGGKKKKTGLEKKKMKKYGEKITRGEMWNIPPRAEDEGVLESSPERGHPCRSVFFLTASRQACRPPLLHPHLRRTFLNIASSVPDFASKFLFFLFVLFVTFDSYVCFRWKGLSTPADLGCISPPTATVSLYSLHSCVSAFVRLSRRLPPSPPPELPSRIYSGVCAGAEKREEKRKKMMCLCPYSIKIRYNKE
jgi:hypothetical protein